MKIGLIARCEYARGLSLQSKNFYDNVPVDRVLLIRMPRVDCAERPDWYPNATHIEYDARDWTLPERQVREWMDGLDVVFSVETPYDWQLPKWAREQGVKTVIQGNPEFVRHGMKGYEHFQHPTEWWWPTSWRLDRLPPGIVMPVPMPDVAPNTGRGDKLRVMHTTGKRAFQDRNGTDIFVAALNVLSCDVHVSAFGLDHSLPELPRPKGWTMTVEQQGVEDRWTMYDDQDVLIMPRRYGGLSLPALEAAARGVAVLMPDISPNESLAQLRITPRRSLRINLPCGVVDSYDTSYMDLATMICHLSQNPEKVATARSRALRDVPRWATWRQIYIDELERVCAG